MPLPPYLMSNFPSVRPSLNLQFDSQPTPEDMTSHLASVGATFSRASIGTYTDANGLIQEASAGQARPNYSSAGVHEGLLIEESRTNLIESSEDFSTTDWTEVNVSTTINQAIAPDGLAGADFIKEDTSTGEHLFHNGQTSSVVTSGTDYTSTIYVKPNGRTYFYLRFGGLNSVFGNEKVWFNLSGDGSVGTNNVNSASIENVGNGWYKCSATETAVSTNNARFMYGLADADNSTSYTGDGESGIYVWGAQVEAGSFPTSYIPTIPTFSSRASTATYFDSSGVLQTQAIQTSPTGVGRTDHKYIDGEWVEAGLLLEGASTNLVTQSENFTTSWTLVNGTLTANDTTAPDGLTTAEKLTSDSDNTYSRVEKFPSTTDNTVYTASAFFKNGNTSYSFINIRDKGSTTKTVYFDIANIEIDSVFNSPDGYTIEQFGDWVRCSVSVNVGTGGGSARVQFGVGGDGGTTTDTGDFIYIWGAQFEEQSQPTSYIPTSGATADRSADVYTTATKERSADVCYIDGTAFTDFYNQEQGTFFVFWEGFTDGGVDRWIGVHDSSKANVFDDRIIFAFSTSAESIRLTIVDDGVTQTSSVIDTNVPQTTPSKYALAVKLNDVNSYQDGVQVFSDSSVTMPSADKLIFHNGAGVRPFQGYIRKLIYFPRRLTNNELIKLTQ